MKGKQKYTRSSGKRIVQGQHQGQTWAGHQVKEITFDFRADDLKSRTAVKTDWSVLSEREEKKRNKYKQLFLDFWISSDCGSILAY